MAIDPNVVHLTLSRAHHRLTHDHGRHTLHIVLNDLMQELVTLEKATERATYDEGKKGRDAYTELLENLSDICMALFNDGGDHHWRLLKLLDDALQTCPIHCTRHTQPSFEERI